jgi:flagellar motor switch protein FliN
MPEDVQNNTDHEKNDPAANTPDGETMPDPQQAAQDNPESDSNGISEPTMDESASVSQNGADTPGNEAAADDKAQSKESPSDDSGELSQEEIEKAFDAVNVTGGEGGETGDNSSPQDGATVADNGESTKVQTGADTISGDHSSDDEINIVRTKEFEEFGKPESSGAGQNIDILLDVTLPISIELGRTSMPIEDILNLGPGSVVELNRLAGEPVDLLVNDKLIAKGEVVVVDENFGVRVTSMVSHEERLKSLV